MQQADLVRDSDVFRRGGDTHEWHLERLAASG
jgi:hypothetical protein